jgi:UDP-N-acetylmuramoyl-L-alanyl-D-glutamate--2,6-diaminopimelate ligase
MLEKILRTIEAFVPKSLYRFFQPSYHFLLALFGALIYNFPSRRITVIMVTGTKGKTSTTEILNNILEANGAKTAVLGTLRFKVGEKNERNMRKMTIPGRFFVQKFLRDAVDAKCTHAIIEMTSEGAKQYRHRFIDADALIFTNLSPEHIESHGSYEAYRDAKLSIARYLTRSAKSERFMVANADDKESPLFLTMRNVTPVPFTLADAEHLSVDEHGAIFFFHGKKISSGLGGKFNVYNALGAATCAMQLGIPLDAIVQGMVATKNIAGRMEYVEAGQGFPVVVDYAHTPDSLEAIYGAFTEYSTICVLGNTGGGRDKWKRPVMGAVAEKYCNEIILTNEDPYDEDPTSILNEMGEGMKTKKPTIILDRREAIARSLSLAKNMNGKPAVLITGKGTDPFIMGPSGSKTPWDDRRVAEEELEKLAIK